MAVRDCGEPRRAAVSELIPLANKLRRFCCSLSSTPTVAYLAPVIKSAQSSRFDLI